MKESNEYRSWYSLAKGGKVEDWAQSIFRDTLTEFSSEISHDKDKLNWFTISGHGNIESVLTSVVEARVAYEARRGEFKGVVNHQKLLTQLCTGLSNIANILPRAALIMRLYATTHVRRVIVAIYTNVLKFLLRALSWYQESKVMHIIHAITRPAGLQYNDLLATILSLSSRMTENALASSHAEQRDMHTDLSTLVHWKSYIEKKVDELMSHLLEVKKCVFTEQAINSSARLDMSQKLSEIQLSQFLQHVSALDLPEPVKAFQASLFISRRRQARPSNRGPPFWLDTRVQRWNNSKVSSLIILDGTTKTRANLQHFCVSSINLLRDSKLPVIWALKSLASDRTVAD
ncbi:hypothetical protein FHL15_006861 [Xylaria flabelliformis]|uniref:DUF7708 domain-containing protein n=1 Tax=Xylaria flabelliformis TaxID=2512241 RepID=A0A553HWB1_9PEZI|nr:hypothetical protein FHL15_006861 [Xylaria flabelliformis]